MSKKCTVEIAVRFPSPKVLLQGDKIEGQLTDKSGRIIGDWWFEATQPGVTRVGAVSLGGAQ